MSEIVETVRILHRIHQQLADLQARLEAGPRKIAVAKAAVAAREAEATKAGEDLQAARVAVDQKQLELKTGEGKIEDLRVKLNTAASNVEYQSFLEQIAAAEMANSVLEDEILEALEKIEQLQIAVGEVKTTVDTSKTELTKLEQLVAEETSSVKADIERLGTELAEAEALLPGDFRAEYQRVVKSKGEDAMAAADGDNCGGCYQQVTPNMANELQLGRVVTCRACGRLLYRAE
ncbi:MAG: phospholipase [Planctomycetota bacterium]|nr:MAG: phospholipase [Planctomycetota bacterium]REJ96538.1 MAG: phospholipase [Planctomycetota bacterium]REK21779.1 MAG: phospholipase [Planctomycetota bacterium]REK43184.1 MAG: phospholipase [Planctomycetota bacterium]